MPLVSPAFFFMEREVSQTMINRSNLDELIKLYIETQRNNLKMLNFIMCYISVMSGAIELIRVAYDNKIPSVVSFFSNVHTDVFFSILMIVLGISIVILKNSSNVYRFFLFILTCCWGWVAFSYLFSSMFVVLNFKHVLVVPIIAQALHMMQMSVFIDGNT